MCVNPTLDMPEAVLGLGGNLGARRAIFRAAIALLDSEPGCRVLGRSQLYATPALGPPQPDYLNAAVRIRFAGDVSALLATVQRIEALLGRERRVRWGARTLDIDVLHWSEGAVQTTLLEVPHRELATRTFALAPLLDVAPELSSEWAAALVQLGGPPPLAVPGWLELTREGDSVCGSWLGEDIELASQLVELLASSAQPSELAGQAVAQGLQLSTHAFTGPAELFDTDDHSWLVKAVADALSRGFVVQMGAVLTRDDTHAAGVLLGFDGARPVTLGPLELLLEDAPAEGPEHTRRVKMRQGAPERGFDFNGSGTM
ncbi:MAG: 2-amino-4-hydroxy-6-hydroxymethyldihydropteridine pyrophosphokinae [Myxococcaceae bacterium]|nr:2-amino-4-hydroxy-6-hydroxymethyldihydropteridine pyrophosphokinae [Myxococcaceae bacterium]